MKLTKLFNDFFHSEKSGGLLLIVCTGISILLANSDWQEAYLGIWDAQFQNHSITHWINDGLMAIFFLLIGLELEREVYIGELSSIKNSMLPVFAAIGGMVAPAAIHLSLNYGTPTQAGAGIPVATDIAFALAVLSLFGSRVPGSLKVFLTALAVIDDLGAILVIAVFYTQTIDVVNLIISTAIFAVLLTLNRLRIHNLIPYLLGGIGMWYFMLHSGVHATITGVLLAFAIPFGDGSAKSPSYILQHALHKPVAFLILPIFALANTAITISDDWYESLLSFNSLGIIMGLVLGKPLGIFLMTLAAIKARLAAMPGDLSYDRIAGVGMLGGIGFTMSIFITLLAFDDMQVIEQSKMAIIIASLLSGSMGYLVLKFSLLKQRPAVSP